MYLTCCDDVSRNWTSQFESREPSSDILRSNRDLPAGPPARGASRWRSTFRRPPKAMVQQEGGGHALSSSCPAYLELPAAGLLALQVTAEPTTCEIPRLSLRLRAALNGVHCPAAVQRPTAAFRRPCIPPLPADRRRPVWEVGRRAGKSGSHRCCPPILPSKAACCQPPPAPRLVVSSLHPPAAPPRRPTPTTSGLRSQGLDASKEPGRG